MAADHVAPAPRSAIPDANSCRFLACSTAAARGGRDEAAVRTARHFDAAHFAERATAPALIALGAIDPVCPAGNVIETANVYGGALELVCDPLAGHGGSERLGAAQAAFEAALLEAARP